MVSKIELFLLLCILFFISRSFYTEVIHETPTQIINQKEIELTTAYLREVNQTSVQSLISADKIIKTADALLFESFIFRSPDIAMKSTKASQANRTIKLEENAIIVKPNGTKYHASSSLYDRDSKVLELIGAFRFEDEFGSIEGDNMKYNANDKKVKGDGVKAIYSID